MKKNTKIVSALALFFCTSFLSVNELKAQNNTPQQSSVQENSHGTVLSLNPGLKSGLIHDETSGEVFEFHYAGIEVLEINKGYIYILQITGSGKIIIRDIRHCCD